MNYTPFVLAGLLAAPSAFAQNADAKDCGLKMYTSVDLIIRDDDDVIIPVSINGTRGGMVLNMSAGLSNVWRHSAAEIPLKPQRVLVNLEFGGARVKQTVTITKFKIGDADFGKAEFLVAPKDRTPETEQGLPLFGNVGMEVFASVDFELDLSRKKLILFSQDHCPGRVVYWTNDYGEAPLFRGMLGELFFPVELEGKKIEATFSPSVSNTVLHVAATKLLYGFDMDSPGVERVADADPRKPAAHYRAMQLTAPGLTVRDTKILLTTYKSACPLQLYARKGGGAGYGEPCGGIHPMSLGANVLRKLRLYFATKENVLYFSAADATK